MITAAKSLQIDEMVALVVGDQFWVRCDNKSTKPHHEVPKEIMEHSSPHWALPTLVSAKERLRHGKVKYQYKNGELLREQQGWQLCKVGRYKEAKLADKKLAAVASK